MLGGWFLKMNIQILSEKWKLCVERYENRMKKSGGGLESEKKERKRSI